MGKGISYGSFLCVVEKQEFGERLDSSRVVKWETWSFVVTMVEVHCRQLSSTSVLLEMKEAGVSWGFSRRFNSDKKSGSVQLYYTVVGPRDYVFTESLRLFEFNMCENVAELRAVGNNKLTIHVRCDHISRTC